MAPGKGRAGLPGVAAPILRYSGDGPTGFSIVICRCTVLQAMNPDERIDCWMISRAIRPLSVKEAEPEVDRYELLVLRKTDSSAPATMMDRVIATMSSTMVKPDWRFIARSRSRSASAHSGWPR